MARAHELAQEMGRPCAVLTFEPHPADYFAGAPQIFRLTPAPAKALALARLGTVDGMIVRIFDAGFADFHFGRGRGGAPAFLVEAGRRHGFEVAVIDKIVADAQGDLAAVSSTAIRKRLEAGDVEAAAVLLGRHHFVLGTVIHGEKLGRQLGFPTANIRLDPSSKLAHGIYAVRVRMQNGTFDGVASYGRRPTFDNGAPLLETYVFRFSGDLYGQQIEVDLVGWIRGEEKFGSAEDLVARMKIDAAEALQILSRAPDL